MNEFDNQPNNNAPQPAQQPAYPQQPGYPTNPYTEQPQKKNKVWPWVLGGCLTGLFLLFIAGCATVACTAAIARSAYVSEDAYDYYTQWQHKYEHDSDVDHDSAQFSLEDIKALSTDKKSIKNGFCSPGVYEVGRFKDISSGLYFLEGDPEEENICFVFEWDDDTNSYKLDADIFYFGNFFISLEDTDVVLFSPSSDSLKMMPAGKVDFSPSNPYQCGLYRVGIDISAGTYTISYNKTSAENASDEAYFSVISSDLDSDTLSKDRNYVSENRKQTVVVQTGDYLRLYACIAEPR